MVIGSFFCICLERPKYLYIATDKATYLKVNPVSAVSHRETVHRVCVYVFRGLETGFSWGWPFMGSRGAEQGAPVLLGGPEERGL